MPSLDDPRQEQFARSVAAGNTLKESYSSAGYKGKGASQSANRLTRLPKIADRIAELRTLAQEIPLASKWLNENFVLQGLKDVFLKALELEKLSDAIAALNLMGKKLGLWIEKVDHSVHWDGDPSTLSDRQLDVLRGQLERIAYGDDAERIREEKERQLRDSGLLIEATAEVPQTQQDAPHQEPRDATPPRRSWADVTDPAERKRLAEEWTARGPALPGDLAKEDRLAWLDANWPLDPVS